MTKIFRVLKDCLNLNSINIGKTTKKNTLTNMRNEKQSCLNSVSILFSEIYSDIAIFESNHIPKL